MQAQVSTSVSGRYPGALASLRTGRQHSLELPVNRRYKLTPPDPSREPARNVQPTDRDYRTRVGRKPELIFVPMRPGKDPLAIALKDGAGLEVTTCCHQSVRWGSPGVGEFVT